MDILVTADGKLSWPGRGGAVTVRCALGRGGVAMKSAEGDGVTPIGRFPLRRLFYRPDRLAKPATGLAATAIGEDYGWCDDPADAAYNKLLLRPGDVGHERLWRADGLYDLVVEIGYNDAPVVAGRGSAIFIHVAGPEYPPTEGCVALVKQHLLALLADCDEAGRLLISGPGDDRK